MSPEKYAAIRKHLNLSQSELAEILGVSRATIARRERKHFLLSYEEQLAIMALALTAENSTDDLWVSVPCASLLSAVADAKPIYLYEKKNLD